MLFFCLSAVFYFLFKNQLFMCYLELNDGFFSDYLALLFFMCR